MNEKMDKKATKTEKDDGMVFQYRNKTITPDMDGPDVMAAIYDAKSRTSYDIGVVLPK
tara:strand:+ start:23 stop:196 length:174 start_codon:yes stop_codon:yes gene_type:complete